MAAVILAIPTAPAEAQQTSGPALSNVLATPATIKLGESSALSWTPRADVEAVLISTDGGLTEETATGTSHVVTPSETTAYELMAMGEGAELGAVTVTVTVTSAPSGPALSNVLATPATIKLGESSALSWTPRADVEAVLISTDGGLTEETATGTSHVVTPSETTAYELMAMGEGAELGAVTVTVTVTSAPSGPALSNVLATPATIKLGESSALSWTPRADVEAVLISTDGGLTEETATGTSHVVTPSETTAYELMAMGEGAELGAVTVTVTVTSAPSGPALSNVLATPATIKLGESSALSWTPRADVEAVLISTDGGLTEETATGTSHVVTPSETTAYELMAMGEGAELGAVTVTVTVTSAPSGPALSNVLATPATIKLGESSALSWTPRADVEAVLISTDGGLTEETATGTSHVVTPSETTAYELMAMGEGAELGAVTVTVTVTSAPSGPALSNVLATPATIKLGESSALSWTPRADVEAVLISTDGGLTEETATGTSHVVTPSETTAYELMAMGEGAELGAVTVTVTVTSAPSGPALSNVLATPATIKLGESSALSWTPRADVEAVLISTDGGLTEETATGTSHVVTPSETTAYELMAMGEGAELGAVTVTVTVTSAPSGPALSNVLATPATIKLGESSALSWTPRADVEAVLISTDGGLTEETATGTSHVVTPSETTAYELMAMGEGAELGAVTVTVTVTSAPSGPALSNVLATPATIKLGESSALSWTPRADVEAVLISTDGGLTEETATGTSHVVTPSETTAYELMAMGEGAELGAVTVTVTVTSAPSGPALSNVLATPATIKLGESSALSWTPRADVEAVLISTDGGLTEETATGTSHVVTPSETTAYELMAMGEGAELGAVTVTVTVTSAPSGPALSNVLATPATVMEGGSSALSWTPRADVSHVYVNGGGLTNAQASGNFHVVTPTETTTYMLSAQDEEGAPLGDFAVTVTVTSAPSGPALTNVMATPATVMEGGSSTLSWTPRADVSHVYVNGGGLTNAQASGNFHVVTPTETTTYMLSAQDEEGAPLGDFAVTVTVTSAPSGPALTNVMATPATVMEGGSSTLSWTPRADVSHVYVNGGGLTNAQASGNFHVVTPTETTTYMLSAQDEEGAPLGDFAVTVTVTSAPSGPALTNVMATPATVMEGGSSTLSWTPRADVSHVYVNGGGLTNAQASGNFHVVTPTETTTYMLSAQDEEGAPLGDFAVTVTVTSAPSGPALTNVMATPATVMEGGSSTLSWTPRADVSHVYVNGGGLTNAQASGNFHVVTPTETTTYMLSAQDEEGAPLGDFAVTVTVTSAPSGPALTNVMATPATVMEGGSSTLSWTPRADVSHVYVNGGGLTNAQASGNFHVVTPTETTTYMLSAQDEEGAPLGDFAVTVTVTSAPSGPALTNVMATPATVMEGGSSTLSWTPRADVSHVYVNGGGLTNAQASGNFHVVTPTETTTYMLSAQDEEGAPLGDFAVTVTVTSAPSGPALTNVMATPATVMEGGSSTLSWTPRADVSHVYVNGGGLTNAQASGNFHVVTPTETTTYMLSAQDEEGAPLGDFAVTVTVTSAPSGPALTNVMATPATVMEGGSSTLSWTPRADVSHVYVNGGGLTNAQASGNFHVVTPTETTTYMLSAQDEEGAPLGDFAVTVTVTSAPSGPALTNVMATPATVMEGGSSTLSWTPRADVSHVYVNGGGLTNAQASGNFHVVTPTETTTYMLSAQDEEGAPLGDFAVTVTVTSAPSGPALTNVMATPATVMEGGSSTLSWTPRADVSHVYVNGGGLTNAQASGNFHVVTPTETTTYMLSAQDEEGAPLGDFAVTVTVTSARPPREPRKPVPPVITSFTANPEVIAPGESSTLSWKVRGSVDSFKLTGNDLEIFLDKDETSYTVTPTETTTYTLSADGTSATATVVVRTLPRFVISPRGGVSFSSQGVGDAVLAGYAEMDLDAGMSTPAGLAIFGSRPDGILVSEATVPAASTVLEGRIFAEIGGAVTTAIALANPNDSPVTVAFFFTDAFGIDSGHGSFTLGPREQIARSLNQEPFNAAAVWGTFSFTANLPVAAIALRGFTNEQSEWLMTTLPVVPLTFSTAETVYFPHFAAGGGWTTQVILVNPTHGPISGSVQFLGPASTAALTLADGRTGSAFLYSIPPRSAVRLQTSNPAAVLQAGSVRVAADPGHSAPAGVSFFSYENGGVTVSDISIPASAPGSEFRVYVEARGTPGQPHSVRSGIALANTSDTAIGVYLVLTALDGTLAGPATSLIIPSSGQVVRFVDELFPALTPPFSGILRIISARPTPFHSPVPNIAAVGLRMRINQRNDVLITTTPAADEVSAPDTSNVFFPHFADSGGWTTQFILFSATGQASSGWLRFTGQDGQPLDLPLVPSADQTIPMKQ